MREDMETETGHGKSVIEKMHEHDIALFHVCLHPLLHWHVQSLSVQCCIEVCIATTCLELCALCLVHCNVLVECTVHCALTCFGCVHCALCIGQCIDHDWSLAPAKELAHHIACGLHQPQGHPPSIAPALNAHQGHGRGVQICHHDHWD